MRKMPFFSTKQGGVRVPKYQKVYNQMYNQVHRFVFTLYKQMYKQVYKQMPFLTFR